MCLTIVGEEQWSDAVESRKATKTNDPLTVRAWKGPGSEVSGPLKMVFLALFASQTV